MDVHHLVQTLRQSKLSKQEIQQLVLLGQEFELKKGQVVIQDGSEGKTFYVLLSGKLEVIQNQQQVAVLTTGAIFGEMSLFNNHIRVGDVRALTEGLLLEIQTSEFLTLVLHQQPVATKLMGFLGGLMMRRLQKQDEELLKKASTENPSLEPLINSFSPLKKKLLSDWALKYHSIGRPGKLAITATKPSGTPQELSVAYSPGVAEPCMAIHKDPDAAYQYTAKSQLVGVITNGTAVLGLGNIGPLASKPVMEGKAILFKRFADIDAFDLEIDETDPDKLIDIICSMEPTFGGINLEDIRSPECFYIEKECKRRMNIPVFHDDQHGTAIISGAGLINALIITGKDISDIKVVFSGAGAAGFSCAMYFLSLGVRKENLLMTDINGVVYKGRGDTDYLSQIAVDTSLRTLKQAIKGADVFVGASVGNVLSPEMLMSMNKDPIVFAMANPTPEIDYSVALKTRTDVIMGTGRSDYPNQINNVIAFPFIFRGALDVRAKSITEEMKHAASTAIAELARLPITIDAGFEEKNLSFGRRYLIPKPFDRRLLIEVASAVAECAIQTGQARKPIDIIDYKQNLKDIYLRE
jgi:malate dehydrogenase (oxaloacetate-decarboxylating)(NADP+)